MLIRAALTQMQGFPWVEPAIAVQFDLVARKTADFNGG